MEDNKIPPSAEILTEEERMAIELFRRLSEEQRDLVLQILAQIKTQESPARL